MLCLFVRPTSPSTFPDCSIRKEVPPAGCAAVTQKGVRPCLFTCELSRSISLRHAFNIRGTYFTRLIGRRTGRRTGLGLVTTRRAQAIHSPSLFGVRIRPIPLPRLVRIKEVPPEGAAAVTQGVSNSSGPWVTVNVGVRSNGQTVDAWASFLLVVALSLPR
jgi:hypothetical protein